MRVSLVKLVVYLFLNYVTSKVAVTLLFLLSVPLGYASSAPAPGACPIQNCTFMNINRNTDVAANALKEHFSGKHTQKDQYPYICTRCDACFPTCRKVKNHAKKEHPEIKGYSWRRDEDAWSHIAGEISRLQGKMADDCQTPSLHSAPVPPLQHERPSTEKASRPNKRSRPNSASQTPTNRSLLAAASQKSNAERNGRFFICLLCATKCASKIRAEAHARARHKYNSAESTSTYWRKISRNEESRFLSYGSDQERLQEWRRHGHDTTTAQDFKCLLCHPEMPGFTSDETKHRHIKEVHGYENNEEAYLKQLTWFEGNKPYLGAAWSRRIVRVS